MRYVVAHPNRAAPRYWYWQRPGFPLTRLPDDPAERVARAAALNASADERRPREQAVIRDGSVRWVVDKYRASERFTELAPGTKAYYERQLLRIVDAVGDLMFASAMTRRIVVEVIESVEAASERRKLRAVLSLLFETAKYYGLTEHNHARGLRMKMMKRRQVVITADEIRALFTAAMKLPDGAGAMRVAYALLLFSAQRPVDCLKMRRGQRAAGWISLKQQKTGKLVSVPEHSALKRILDAAQEAQRSMYLVADDLGRPISYARFNAWSREVRRLAGLPHIQDRDFRRTAIVMMAEAGATEPEISAISGHTKAYVSGVIETYLPATRALAEAAIGALESRFPSLAQP